MVVVGANDGVVRGLDAATGAVGWEVTTGGQVRGGILGVDDTAYLVSDDGVLHALSATGQPLWAAEFGEVAEPRGDYNNYGSRPALSNGTVYAASESGHVAAVNAANGEVLWSVNVGSPVETGLAVSDARVHVSTMGGYHYALSIEDGSQVWELSTVKPATTTPLIMDGKVILGSRSTYMMVRDEATGEKVWSAAFGSSWVQSGAAAIDDTTFAIGSSDYKAVRAFDITSGQNAWLTSVGGWTWAVPVAVDGTVYASEIRLDYQLPWDTAIYAIDGVTGAILWTAEGGPALEWAPDDYPAYGNGAGPAVTNGLVVVPGLDGVVRAFPAAG